MSVCESVFRGVCPCVSMTRSVCLYMSVIKGVCVCVCVIRHVCLCSGVCLSLCVHTGMRAQVNTGVQGGVCVCAADWRGGAEGDLGLSDEGVKN